MMGSQNKWVDYALKRTLIDAVNDPSVDYLALPKDERAIGAVGGSYSPKTGAINYYNRDVQNRFNNLLKSIDPDARTETIFLQSDGNNYIDDDFDAYALLDTRVTSTRERAGLVDLCCAGCDARFGLH